MISRLGSVLLMVAALLLFVSCTRPLNGAAVAANLANESLKVEYAKIWASRKSDQLAAAARVEGDRSDPAVRSEQRRRVAIVGREYRKVWDLYDVAWNAWARAARIIHAAQLLEKAGGSPDLRTIAQLLLVLADAQHKLSEVLSRGRE